MQIYVCKLTNGSNSDAKRAVGFGTIMIIESIVHNLFIAAIYDELGTRMMGIRTTMSCLYWVSILICWGRFFPADTSRCSCRYLAVNILRAVLKSRSHRCSSLVTFCMKKIVRNSLIQKRARILNAIVSRVELNTVLTIFKLAIKSKRKSEN